MAADPYAAPDAQEAESASVADESEQLYVPAADEAQLTVRAVANPHGSTTALAFRFEENGRSFVYASDVGYPDSGPSTQILDLYQNHTGAGKDNKAFLWNLTRLPWEIGDGGPGKTE